MSNNNNTRPSALAETRGCYQLAKWQEAWETERKRDKEREAAWDREIERERERERRIEAAWEREMQRERERERLTEAAWEREMARMQEREREREREREHFRQQRVRERERLAHDAGTGRLWAFSSQISLVFQRPDIPRCVLLHQPKRRGVETA